jgi:hypothetical protein
MTKLSLMEMFLIADDVVKAVMILLILASLASWVVIIEKTLCPTIRQPSVLEI